MIDALLYGRRRAQMVRDLCREIRCSAEVKEALEKVPRHLFIEPGLEHMAYEDKPLPIGQGQTMSQPSTVAMQTLLLDVRRGDKILEIGTGCGYQTAILAEMGARVFSIERQHALYLQSQRNLARTGYSRALVFFGDGYAGLPKFAPFKGIIVTCGAPAIPRELLLQLEIGGKMIIPIAKAGNRQTLTVLERVGEKEFNKTSCGEYSFVPMLEGVNREQ